MSSWLRARVRVSVGVRVRVRGRLDEHVVEAVLRGEGRERGEQVLGELLGLG